MLHKKRKEKEDQSLKMTLKSNKKKHLTEKLARSKGQNNRSQLQSKKLMRFGHKKSSKSYVSNTSNIQIICNNWSHHS